MQKTKRKGRGSAFEDGFSNLVKSCGNSSSELTKQIESKLSESVVSLASFEGDTVVSECTGILIENLCANTTTILTSANLVGSLDDGFNEKLTIKVRLPSDRVVFGLLETFDSTYDLAVVKIRRVRGFQEAHLSSSHPVQFESNSKVVAVGRCFDSGMLKFTNGTATGPASEQIRELMLSTHKMNTDLNGCPLIDFDGNFVGANFRRGKNIAFVPMNKILEFLGYSGTTRHSASDTDDKRGSNRHSAADTNDGPDSNRFGKMQKTKRNDCPPSDLYDDAYEMRVMYSFEEEFEDNIWSTLSEDVASTMSECVVSLASFNGDTRCFACTGVFIGCNPMRILTSASLVRASGDGNKIDHNLQIQVYLNNKRHVIGTLKHYNLRYNVAVVEIMGSYSFRAVDLETHIHFAPDSEVVAVGCLFKHRKLMASRGLLIGRKSKLACEELRISTCEITKAGIGGPLIDTCGNFVGMNFFHEEETPYLPREKIQKVLGYYDDEWHNAADIDANGGSDSWPVPKQYWCYPPFCAFSHRRFYSKEEADAAWPPQLCVDEDVYFDTYEKAFSITSMAWC